jgi:hypothetical protein
MPKAAKPWSLTSLREKLIKIGAKVVSHGRYVTFQMAEVALSWQIDVQGNPDTDRPAASTARSGMRDAGSDYATNDDGKGMCPDAGKISAFQRLSPRNCWIDCLLRPQCAFCRCPRRPMERSWPHNHRNPGNVD